MTIPQLHAAQTTAARQLSTGGAIRQLLRNSGQIARNAGSHLMQNPSALKSNSLIVSSLILVISRIIVANLSALHTKGTPEGPYRYRESVRTTIREICGWTFGFAVLRQFQNMVSWGMRKGFGIQFEGASSTPSSWAQLREATGKAFKGLVHDIPKPPGDPAIPIQFRYNETGAAKSVLGLLQKIPGLRNQTPKALMQGLYHWAPIALGSIPAVFLAGYALERFTRDHSDRVVDTVSRHFNRDGGARAKASPVSNPAQNRFNNYLSHVQARQVERGMPTPQFRP